MPKKALLTGSKGFIGKALSQELKKRYDLIEVDIADEAGIDLKDWAKVKEIPPVDVVFHLAALMDVPLSFAEPRKIYETNILTTLNILEYCRQKDIGKLVFASSYVYGHPQYLPIDENHSVSATNPYMHTKLIGERLCQKYAQWFDLNCVILRVFNVYGPGQKVPRLIPTILKQLPKGRITLKDAKTKRDFLYVSDVVSAYLKAGEYKDKKYEIFNIGSGKSFSVKQVAEEIIKIYGKKVEVEYLNERRKGEIDDVVANIEKTERLLGWSPKISFKDGLKEILESQ